MNDNIVVETRSKSVYYYIGAIVLLTIGSAFIPFPSSWGFNYLNFLDPAYLFIYVAFVTALMVVTFRGRFDRPLTAFADAMHDRPHGFLALAIVLFFISGIVFRVKVPLLGDSWFLIGNISGVVRGTDIPIPRDEPLATYYLSAR